MHQFANASSLIFTHSRLFQNSCLFLKKKGGQAELAVEEKVLWGSRASVSIPSTCVTQMPLFRKVSQASSSKPLRDRQPLCYLNCYTGKKKKDKKFLFSLPKFSLTRYQNPTEITPKREVQTSAEH